MFVLSRTDCDLCSAGMWPPAVLRGGGSRLLPAGRTHPVQELQRSPHPGPVGQNLHRLLTNFTLISRTHYMLLIHKTVQTENPAPLRCGLDINIAIVPCVGSKSCRVTFSVTSHDDTLAFLFDAQLRDFQKFSILWPDLQAAWAPPAIFSRWYWYCSALSSHSITMEEW